jgi:hypothetical protein
MARRHHIGALSRMAAANAFMGESGWASIALATRMRRTCPTRAAGSSSEATTRRDPSRRNRCRAPLAGSGTESSQTLCWREVDSNHWYPAIFAPRRSPEFTLRNMPGIPRDKDRLVRIYPPPAARITQGRCPDRRRSGNRFAHNSPVVGARFHRCLRPRNGQGAHDVLRQLPGRLPIKWRNLAAR